MLEIGDLGEISDQVSSEQCFDVGISHDSFSLLAIRNAISYATGYMQVLSKQRPNWHKPQLAQPGSLANVNMYRIYSYLTFGF